MLVVIISAMAAFVLVLILTAVLIWCGLYFLIHAAFFGRGNTGAPEPRLRPRS